MRWLILLFLVLGAHFSLTAIAPGEAGKALFYWPFAKDSQPTINFLGSSTKVLAQLLSIVAGLCLLAAAAALLGWLVPAGWWVWLVIIGAVSSGLLFLLYIGPYAILPLVLDAVLLFGIAVWHWTATSLQGG